MFDNGGITEITAVLESRHAPSRISPVPSASNTASKCPGSLRGGGGIHVKNHCVGLRPALPLLKQE